MAIVKTLIVKGVARFLTDAYMSTIRSGIWNGSTIQVGYGGTGVTSAKGNLYTPVFLSSSGIAPCSAEIPHATKDFKINGKTYAVFTNSTESNPTIYAPTTLAGTGGYILATNAAKTGLEWVAKPAANVTTSAVVAAAADGTTQISAAQSNPFYNLLEGGAVTRSIQFKSSNITISSTTGGVISFTAASWAGATSEAAGTAGYMPGAASADRLKYLRGDGSWVALAPSISAGTATNTVKITVGGENSSDFTVPYATNADKLDNYDSSAFLYKTLLSSDLSTIEWAQTYAKPKAFVYNTHNAEYSYLFGLKDDKTYGTILKWGYTDKYIRILRLKNNTWQSTDWEKISAGYADSASTWTTARTFTIGNTGKSVNGSADVSWTLAEIGVNTPEQLAKVSKSLKVDTWTDMGAVSSYTGTYAIQISSGNVYASGVFTACGGTDSVIDEIPLHVADKGTNTWRPYARIKAGQLQMTTNEATGTSREYTIKILKLI